MTSRPPRRQTGTPEPQEQDGRSLLEERYRRVLRMLPAAYRRRWEEDMVAAFLEAAHASDPDDPEGVGLGSPRWGEVASVAALAVRLRLGGDAAVPRSFTWGEAVRRVALVGLLVHAVGAVAGVILTAWITHRLPLPAALPADWSRTRWETLLNLVTLLWLPAYLALVQGHRRAAGILSAGALAPTMAASAVSLAADPGAYPLSAVAWLLFAALPVVALAAFHQEAPPVAPRPWLVALPAGVVLTLLLAPLGQLVAGRVPLIDLPGLCTAGLVVAALTRLARVAHWALALALLAAATLGLRLVTLLELLGHGGAVPGRSAFIAVAVAESVVLLMTAVTLAVRAARALRHLAQGDLA